MMRSEGSRRARGFTLLEVLVAMTITGLALGAIMTAIGGSKRLSWRSEDALVASSQTRSQINLAQLNDGKGFAQPDFSNRELQVRDDIRLDTPERKTLGSIDALREFEILDANGELLTHGTYWVELTLPE